MKRLIPKTVVLALIAAAAVSAYRYREAYLQYLPGRATSVSEAPIPPAASPDGTRAAPYLGRGVIREVRTDTRRIVIAHEEIPGFMAAMTMEYPVSEDVPLESLNASEVVEFQLERTDSEPLGYRVFSISGDGAAAVDPGAALFDISPDRRQLIGVRTAPVEYRTVERTVRTIGTVAIDETRVSEVHPRVAGWIEETFVHFQYQLVVAGDPLFTLYSPELVATQEEYLLALRGMDMLGGSAFPSVRLGAEDLVRATRRRLQLWGVTPEQIADLDRIREPFQTMTIHSPVDGHVMARNAFAGQRVTPETALYEIADHSNVWVKADIYENDIATVGEGQRAAMQVQALPGREFAGQVTFIDPHVNEQTRTLTVRLEFPNADLSLKPGMFAEVQLHAPSGRRLVVPESAVLPTGLRNIVFVDRADGRMEIRDVQLGARTDDHYEVLGGLSEGEQVVVSGNFLIDAESRLQAAEPVWQGETGR